MTPPAAAAAPAAPAAGGYPPPAAPPPARLAAPRVRAPADADLTLAWMRAGGVCGTAAIAAYLAAAFAPVPDAVSRAAAFAFGPLLAVGAWGLYHGLALVRRGPLVQVAAAAAAAGGVTVLIMLATQQAIVVALRDAAAGGAGDPAALRAARAGVHAVHLGMDVAWDVFISTAVILFGAAMTRHPRFGRVMGALGVALGVLLLGFNLWYFPTPPASARSVDWGPFVALWLLAAFVLLLRALPWARARAAGRAGGRGRAPAAPRAGGPRAAAGVRR